MRTVHGGSQSPRSPSLRHNVQLHRTPYPIREICSAAQLLLGQNRKSGESQGLALLCARGTRTRTENIKSARMLGNWSFVHSRSPTDWTDSTQSKRHLSMPAWKMAGPTL